MVKYSLLSIASLIALTATAQHNVPYFEDFSTLEDFNTYTIIDGYNDGCTWELNTGAADAYAWCRYNASNPKDEWFISPAINLEADKEYTLSFKAFAFNPDWPEHMDVFIGQGLTVQSMTQQIMPKTKLSNDISPIYTFTLTVPETGAYNVGFHACSNADMHMIGLDKVSITEGGTEEHDYSESDLPSPVTDVTLREHDGVLDLHWEAPVTGAHGGKLAPGLKYKVLDNHGMLSATITQTGMKIEGYHFDTQKLTYFTITPVNDEGEGISTRSNYILLGGDYYTLPVLDTFDNGPITSIYWNYEGFWHIYGYNGIVQGYQPYDGHGCVYTIPGTEGERSLFFSGNITLQGSIQPAFDFYYYNLPTSANALEVLVSVETDAWETLQTVTMDPELSEGWHCIRTDLSPYMGCRYLQVGIRSIGGADCSPILIDHFQLHDILDYNLSVEEFDVPALATAGTPYHTRVHIQNVGLQKAEGYTVHLMRNGVERCQVAGPAILPGETAIVELADCATAAEAGYYPYSARLLWAEDENNINDASESIWIQVLPNTELPVPAQLTATCDPADAHRLKLTWSPVDPLTGVMHTETFEDYRPFTLTELGDWSLYDADGQDSYYALSNKYPSGYPNSGLPMAWQVLSLEKLGFDRSNSYFSTVSGVQILSSFVTTNPDITADDWLISPALSGEAHTLSFWACSPVAEVYGPDQFEVFGSTTGNSPEDFTEVLSPKQDAPADWTQFSVEVPQGVRYFAIRHTAGDTFLMSLDDIRYSAMAPAFLGYNVYADGVLLNAEPLPTAQYEGVVPATDAVQHYAVTALYAQAESALSQAVTVDFSGIQHITSDADYQPLYNLFGQRLEQGTASGIVIDAKGRITWK